ncbi:hypothetical protein SLA2020_350500 [Shorea laevis]
MEMESNSGIRGRLHYANEASSRMKLFIQLHYDSLASSRMKLFIQLHDDSLASSRCLLRERYPRIGAWSSPSSV